MDTKRNDLHAEMYAHYSNWKASGQSQIGYCKSKGLSFFKFNYWVRKLRGDTKPASPSPLASGFVTVEVAPSGVPVFEISHKNGHRISFYQTIEVHFIKELLS